MKVPFIKRLKPRVEDDDDDDDDDDSLRTQDKGHMMFTNNRLSY